MDYDSLEITIDVHPLAQKSGRVLQGGDCGYCCIAGIFKLPTILSAYEKVESHMPEEGGHKRRSFMDFYRVKLLLESLGHDYNQFSPKFNHYKVGMLEYPWNNLGWIDDVQNYIKDGCIFLASIRFTRGVPPEPRKHADHDHNVIINGYREYFAPIPNFPKSRRQEREVRISCSARGKSYWIDWKELLYWHGCVAVVIPKEIHDCETMTGIVTDQP